MTIQRPVAVAACLLAGAALVAVLAYGVAHQHASRSIDRPVAAGDRPTAPGLHLPRLGVSGEAAIADWRGKVVVVNFWASWCEPCRDESPLLQRWHRRLDKRGGLVLGVDVQDISGDARAFAAEYGLTYPLLRDGPGDLRDEFGILGLPETFVVDRRGRIAAVARGPVDDKFMRRHVAPLLRERA